MFRTQGAFLFKSGLTRRLFQNFSNENLLNRKSTQHDSLFYVELETGSIRFVTDCWKSTNPQGQVYALGISKAGDLEILGTDS